MRNNLEDYTDLPEPQTNSLFFGQTPQVKDSADLSQRSLLGLELENKSLLLSNTEQKYSKAALNSQDEVDRTETVNQGAQPASNKFSLNESQDGADE